MADYLCSSDFSPTGTESDSFITSNMVPMFPAFKGTPSFIFSLQQNTHLVLKTPKSYWHAGIKKSQILLVNPMVDGSVGFNDPSMDCWEPCCFGHHCLFIIFLLKYCIERTAINANINKEQWVWRAVVNNHQKMLNFVLRTAASFLFYSNSCNSALQLIKEELPTVYLEKCNRMTVEMCLEHDAPVKIHTFYTHSLQANKMV